MASPAWTLTGNAGTNPTVNSLGTTDNEPLIIETNGAERLRVDTSGNVGIGTTTPQKPLDVAATGGIRIGQTAPASNSNEVYFEDNGQIRSSDDTHRIIFNRAGNELELREYGTITFSPGATQGQRTGTVSIDSAGLHLGYTGMGAASDAMGSSLVFSSAVAESALHGVEYVPLERVRIDSGGRVGIGASSPRSLLEVSGIKGVPGLGRPTVPPVLTLTNATGDVNATTSVDFNTFPPSSSGNYNPSSRIVAVDAGNFANDFVFLSNNPGAANNGLVEQMRITSQGNVGIGTNAPASRLHVAGDVTVTGDVLLTGADCAEQFDAVEDLPGPGTVVVINEKGALRESREAYDKKVAGVISGAGEYRPGLVLDKRESEEGRVPVALVGKVYCKVDAQYSPIEVGDLLTTSPTPGHAMKAVDPLKAFGCVVGKALCGFETGRGLIPVLVALQ